MKEKQTSWSIVCTDSCRGTANAAGLINKEAGKRMIRYKGVYTLYVLPVIQAENEVKGNAFLIGKYSGSALIRSLVPDCDLSAKDAHLMKVVKNPFDEGAYIVIITSESDEGLYHAALDFTDRYIYDHPCRRGNLRFPDLVFDEDMEEAEYISSPKAATRGIFSWGTPINDYRAYFENMARMKLNQLILWNDYVPVNAKDIIACAHKYGIEIIWGYSWGWGTDGSKYLSDINADTLESIKKNAISYFEENILPLDPDGIYFQSFTESQSEYFGNILIADAVTELVNGTSAALLAKYPDLHIQFGLHCSSVRKHLDSIAKIDRRVEIVWEDFGVFPSHYEPDSVDSDGYAKLLETTKELIDLRGDAPLGLVFKGFMVLDWTRFVYQSGPYVMGENSPEITSHDAEMRRLAWRRFSSEWAKYGDYARRLAEYATEKSGGRINLCMAGTFDGGIHLPEALCSSFFYDPNVDFADVLADTLRQEHVLI